MLARHKPYFYINVRSSVKGITIVCLAETAHVTDGFVERA